MSMSIANRREPRLRAQVPVIITQGKKALTAITEDVSYHGLYIAIDERPGLRQLIRVEVQIRGTETFATHATVVRHGDDYGRNGIGLEFFGRTESALWDQFVQETQRNPPQIMEQAPGPRPPPAPPPQPPPIGRITGPMAPIAPIAPVITPAGGMPPFQVPPMAPPEPPRTPSRAPPPLPPRGPRASDPGSDPQRASAPPPLPPRAPAPPGPPPAMPQMLAPPGPPQMPPPPAPPQRPLPPAPPMPQMAPPPPPTMPGAPTADPAAGPPVGLAERRRHQRHPFPADIRLRTNRSMHATQGIDASLGGVSLCGPDLALNIGEQVILNLAQPGTNFTFRLDAIVRRTLPSPHPGTYAFGCEFLPLDPTRFALLAEFLEAAKVALGHG